MPARWKLPQESHAEEATRALADCTVADAAQAQAQPGGRRRQVVVNGRRVKTVDVHGHCVIPEAMALKGETLQPKSGQHWSAKQTHPDHVIVAQERIRLMDEQGIDVQALSINPNWYTKERDLVSRIIKIQNEGLAEICAAYPERFVAFASVALQYPELAAQQLDEAVRKLGLRGAAVGGSVNGEDFSDSKYDPFWAKAEQLGILIFIHPQRVPELANRFKGNGALFNVIGNPLDTTLALSHLILNGTLDRFPGLKICAAHGGGYLPSYAARSDYGMVVFPEMYDGKIGPKKKPTEYLKQIYFDSLVFTSEALRHLAAEAGPGQIVMGTDHPVPWQGAAVDHILDTPSLSDSDREAMLGGTAAKLLGIDSAFH